jgi:hypothetical protein
MPNQLVLKFCIFSILVVLVCLVTVNVFWKDLRTHLKITEISQPVKTVINASSVEKKKDKIILVYWSLFFGSVPHFVDHLNLEKCPVPCEVTSNKTKAQNASALIIHARDPYPLPPVNLENIPWILQSWENAVNAPMLSNPDYLAKFTYLFTHRLDVTDFYLPSFGKPSIKPLPLEFTQKKGLIMAAFSNCEPARTAYMKELMKHIQVDSYGGCLKNKEGLEARYATGNFKKSKIELSRKYKFTIVFHNQDCDYFVDDQLTHALNAGSIPVYLGTDKVSELLPGNLRDSIIKVKDFKNPKKLAEYLKLLSGNEALYNRYLRWKYEGFQVPESFYSTVHGRGWQRLDQELPYDVAYCSICEKFTELKSQGKPIKAKGLIKPDNCRVRKIEDWLRTE